jgi:6-phosphogluconolactonase
MGTDRHGAGGKADGELAVEELPDADAVAARVTDLLVEGIGRAIMARGRAVIALSGGSTPVPMYRRLAAAQLDWGRVHILQVDERFAPDGHADRNYAALHRELIGPTGAIGYPMPTGGAVHPGLATEYAHAIDLLCGGTIDVVHLGIGDDGHTASLVPGDPVLRVAGPVALTGSYAGRRRMTMTAPLINAATAILWQVAGAGKAGAVQRLIAADPGVPAHLIRRLGQVTVVADRAALGMADETPSAAPADGVTPSPSSEEPTPPPEGVAGPGRLLVKATHSLDDPERANLACNIAAVALASGAAVDLFLAVEGVRLALPDIGQVMGEGVLAVAEAPAIGDLIDAVYAAGTVTVCTPCATRRGLGPEDFRAGTVMGGSAVFVELALRPDVTALVY